MYGNVLQAGVYHLSWNPDSLKGKDLLQGGFHCFALVHYTATSYTWNSLRTQNNQPQPEMWIAEVGVEEIASDYLVQGDYIS